MSYLNNPKLTPFAQTLRKSMTVQEKHLWYDFLKKLPVTVNRQKTIGVYILDFYIASHRVCIELDGPIHRYGARPEHDRNRDAYLRENEISVYRFSNEDIEKRFPEVCEKILGVLGLTREDLRK